MAPGLLGLGITALIAGFMSGMAGNVSAFSAVWTYDIYQPLINKNAKDEHYVTVGRWATLLGVIVSIGTAYLVMPRAGIMDYVQALFSFFISPLLGVVLMGMFWKRATKAGGFWGLLIGTLTSIGLLGMGQHQSRGAALCRPLAGRQGNGRKYVPRLVVGDHLRAGHLRGEPVDQAHDRWRSWTALVYGATKLPIEEPVPFYKNEWCLDSALQSSSFLGLNIYFW